MLGDRLGAYLVDFLLLTVVTALVWFVFTVVRTLVGIGGRVAAEAGSAGPAAAGPSEGGLAALVGASLLQVLLGFVQWAVIGLALAGYFVLLQEGDGQTLGKRLTDVAVVSADGSAADRSQLVKRTAVLLAPLPLMAVSAVIVPIVGLPIALALMTGWLGLEALLMAVDDEGRRLGDRFAGTRVVQAG